MRSDNRSVVDGDKGAGPTNVLLVMARGPD
jgi:hypothetical protein